MAGPEERSSEVKECGTVWQAAVVATGSTNVEQGSLISVDGGSHAKDLIYSAKGGH